MTAVNRLTVGLVVNPYAGIGGAIALKGSDGADVREKALTREQSVKQCSVLKRP